MIGTGRLFELAALFLLVAALVAGRVYRLQITQHEYWEAEALKTRTQSRSLPFRRGAILDCEGRPIAKSESSYDLEFEFRDFRKKTTTGQILLVHYLLSSERARVLDILRDPAIWLDQIEALSVGEYRKLQPWQRRRDLLVYLAWLLGNLDSAELGRRVATASSADPVIPSFSKERVRIEDRVWAESGYLCDLEDVLELERGQLAKGIDQAIRWADQQVLRQLELRGEVERAFEVERALHREYDERRRRLHAGVPHRDFFHLQVEEKPLAGLSLSEQMRRVYPAENQVCAVLVGTVGSPWEEDLKASAERMRRVAELRVLPRLSREDSEELRELQRRLRCDDYREGEEVGRFGLELCYEAALRGRRGWLKDIADPELGGRQVLESEPAVHGRDLRLSLDSELQQAAMKALSAQPWNGAVVLLELPTAAIRVLASRNERGRAQLEKFGLASTTEDRDHPLHPEAWRPFFPPPPGSVMKPLFAGLALADGVITSQTRFLCAPGSLVAGGRAVGCLGVHGEVELRTALVRSCNHYFARLAAQVGYPRVFSWSEALGFGRASGFAHAALPGGEVFRRLNPPEAACPLSRRGMTERNLLLFGIGQGAIDDVTPLAVAAAMGALAMREYRSPILIEGVGGEVPLRAEPFPLPISDSAWHELVNAMRGVTADEDGTANFDADRGLDLRVWDLATKTGTPQNAGAPDHSWFAGFFPAHAPRYAFAVFLAHTDQHGGEVCAPLFQEMLLDPAFHEVETLARRTEQ